MLACVAPHSSGLSLEPTLGWDGVPRPWLVHLLCKQHVGVCGYSRRAHTDRCGATPMLARVAPRSSGLSWEPTLGWDGVPRPWLVHLLCWQHGGVRTCSCRAVGERREQAQGD